MKHTRLLAALTALSMLPCSACGLVKEQRKGATLEVDLSKSYALEEVTMQGSKLDPLTVVDEGIIMTRYSRKDGYKCYLRRNDTGEFLELGDWHPWQPIGIGRGDNGSYILIQMDSVGREGGHDVIDYKTRTVEVFDQNLKLSESFAMPDEVPVSSSFVQDGDGNWAVISSDDEGYYGYYLLDPNFHLKGEIKSGINPDAFVCGASGTLYGKYTNDAGYATIQRLNADTMQMEEIGELKAVGIRDIMNGNGDYELYYSVENGIYGMRADGTSELVVDYWNSDLPDDVWRCFALRDGSFIVNYIESLSNNSCYYRLKKRTEEELASIQCISLAGVALDKRLVQDVTKYNQSQSAYRIVMKDYGKEMLEDMDNLSPEIQQEIKDAANEWRDPYINYTPAIEQFKSDLLSGTVPDIVCMDDLPSRSLSNKGLFADFAPMLAADERFDESLYYMNFLDGLKTGDRLERIGFSFHLETVLGKTDLVGEQQGRNVDEYIEMLENRPEGTAIFGYAWDNRDTYLDLFALKAQNAFINEQDMSCSFNSPTFVKILELAKSVPPYDEADSEWTQVITEDELQNYALGYSEGKILLARQDYIKPIQYHEAHYGDFRREDVTLVGYPETGTGNGGMYYMKYTISLTAQSNMQEPVWDFIMDQLSKPKQSKMCMDSWNWEANSFPVMREPLENAILAATRGANRDLGNMNEQEAETFLQYFENVRMYDNSDINISYIILEEAQKYFNGDCTSQQAADAIQSRCSLYLSELA
ncbi:MAG: hypothetical protein II916_04675 [Oscillospiraceae bacterium]|nr:hypothetical protein [Oscillospiraceae bacterium]